MLFISMFFLFFFFNDTATTEIYPLSLHDALPISVAEGDLLRHGQRGLGREQGGRNANEPRQDAAHRGLRTEGRSEEHTSELQSLAYLVCRLLLEKKKKRHANEPSQAYTYHHQHHH